MLTKADIEQYFLAEKNASLVFLVAGVIGIVMSIILLLLLKTSFYKGMALVCCVFGLTQLIVGYNIYRKADRQRVDIVYAYDLNPDKIGNTELPRVTKALAGIRSIMIAELLAFVIGMILLLTFRASAGKEIWLGVGLALIIQGTMALIFDIRAYRRTQNYFLRLTEFVNR